MIWTQFKKKSLKLHSCLFSTYYINPLTPMSPKWGSLTKISILFLEGFIKQSYERRAYESVD